MSFLDTIRQNIFRAMRKDRARFQSRLRELEKSGGAGQGDGLKKLEEDVAASVALTEKRRAGIPRMVYDEELPVSRQRKEIADAIRGNQVVVVCGETGSGKSTQLPKICLELGFGVTGMIGHTQPRRIAASSIASRLSKEISGTGKNAAEEHGSRNWSERSERNDRITAASDSPLPSGLSEMESDSAIPSGRSAPFHSAPVPAAKLVGYKIRFTDYTSPETCVKLMTDGILLAETQGDRNLDQYDVIIIDEAHERSLNIDFLIGILRRLVDRRKDLKVIITSATIDARRFAEHFSTPTREVPIIEVSGRAWPVEVIYQPLGDEDSESADENDTANFRDGDVHLGVIRAISQAAMMGQGDMLVFMPTERDIHEVAKMLHGERTRRQNAVFTTGGDVEILPLYARLPAAEQQAIFDPGPKRRIVIATNVAESSVTVPRIRYVIDTGTARISRYSTRTKMQRLPVEAVSQASADQRKGRCGRIGPGVCFRLYTEADYRQREKYTQPEIQRTNLASVILQTKVLRLGHIETFPFLDPPKKAAIRDGYKTLFELGALTTADADGEVTELGYRLSRLPMDPRIGRMILAAVEEAKTAAGNGAKRSDRIAPSNDSPPLSGHCASATFPAAVSQGNNPLHEVLVIAAALEIRDPRERPVERQAEADAAHAKFLDSRSDFISLVRLWNFYHHLKETLSRNQLQKACRQNFLSWNRMREWTDMVHQFTELVQDMLRETKTPDRFLRGDITRLPVGDGVATHVTPEKYAAVHRAILAGMLANIGWKQETTKEYRVGGGGTCFLWPGSGIFKQCVSGGGKPAIPEQSEVKEAEKKHGPKAGARFFGRKLSADGKPLDAVNSPPPEGWLRSSRGGSRTQEPPQTTPPSGHPSTGGEYHPVGCAATPPQEGNFKKPPLPVWTVAAEMVETTKRYLRTVAEINPEWAEELAPHLVSRTYSSPHWSKSNNAVMVYEKVTLFGLMIVPKRRVPYSRINAADARELFLRHGLVEGKLVANLEFYTHNRELLTRLEQLQVKLRRHDFLPGDWKLYDFYDRRIPMEVHDLPTLEKWLKHLRTGEAHGPDGTPGEKTLQNLKMTEADVLEQGVDRSIFQLFPDTWSLRDGAEGLREDSPRVTRLNAPPAPSVKKTSSSQSEEDSASLFTGLTLFGKKVETTKKTSSPQNVSLAEDSGTAAGNVAQRSDRIAPPNDSPLLSGHCASAPFPAAVSQLKTYSQFPPQPLSLSVPLEYRFEPGMSGDGVTVQVTLETVNQIDPRRLEWGIPGLFEERIAALIKSLPKDQRRKLIPAPDTARRLCEKIVFGRGYFLPVLAAELTRLAGELIRPEDLKMEEIPAELQMNIRVVDKDGKTLAENRSYDEILRAVGHKTEARFAAIPDSRWRRDGITAWDFGELPIQAEVAGSTGRVTAYPMLTDAGKSVSLRLANTLFHAENATRRAVIRLFRLAANRELTHQAEWFPELGVMKNQAFSFLSAAGVSLESLIADALAGAVCQPAGISTLTDLPSLVRNVPRDKTQFEKLCREGRVRIPLVVQDIGRPLAALWSAYHAATKALDSLCVKRGGVSPIIETLKIGGASVTIPNEPGMKRSAIPGSDGSGLQGSTRSADCAALHPRLINFKSPTAVHPGFQPTVDDISRQLSRLMPTDFLLTTSWENLRHYPRYLHGIAARIESLRTANSGFQQAATTGKQHTEELENFWRRYESLREDFHLRGISQPELERFRWMLEEYRVSLFAQKLGTAVPVSAKRLEKMWDAISKK